MYVSSGQVMESVVLNYEPVHCVVPTIEAAALLLHVWLLRLLVQMTPS
jgi:hypothetical protein